MQKAVYNFETSLATAHMSMELSLTLELQVSRPDCTLAFATLNLLFSFRSAGSIKKNMSIRHSVQKTLGKLRFLGKKLRPSTAKTLVVQMIGEYKLTEKRIKSAHPELDHSVVCRNKILYLAKLFRSPGARAEIKLWRLFGQASPLHVSITPHVYLFLLLNRMRPNISKLIEIFKHQSTKIIITEYSIRYSLLCKATTSPGEVRSIMKQLLSAIQWIHDKNIVHCAISQDYIFF